MRQSFVGSIFVFCMSSVGETSGETLVLWTEIGALLTVLKVCLLGLVLSAVGNKKLGSLRIFAC